MRIDMPQLPDSSVLQVRARAGAYTHSLDEGDVIKAEVLSGDKGAVVMRSEGGQIFRARLESGVALSPGDELFLQVTGKEEGVIYLSVREGIPAGSAESLAMLTRDFEDKSLAPFAEKLAQLNMTVSEDSARVMRGLMERYPEMSLEEAAFIAENNLQSDDSLVNAAIALLSSNEKTDAMVGKLLELLNMPENIQNSGNNGADRAADAVRPAEAGTAAQDMPAATSGAENASGGIPAQESPLTVFLSFISSLTTRQINDPQQPAQPNARIISQDGSDMQFRIDSNVEENSQNVVSRVEISTQGLAEQEIAGEQGTVTGGQEQRAVSAQDLGTRKQDLVETGDTRGQETVDTRGQVLGVRGQETGDTRGQETGDARGQGAGLARTQAGFQETEASVRSPQFTSISAQLAAAVAELPEFRGTPPSAIERFSDMLQRVAEDSADIKAGDNEKLADLLAKLLTRIDRSGADAGERLKSARQEIFARLALLEEAIARAAPPARAEMADQTRRLMDHVRLMNSIEQFTYMQLPVTLGEQRRTAELYIFKRKGGGKKIDPDNVNILLALDLEYMGHWEALLNIRNKDVSVRMEVSGADEKDFFKSNTVLLHEMLEEAGFRLVSTDITFPEKAEEPTSPLTALRLLDRLSAGRIDYVV